MATTRKAPARRKSTGAKPDVYQIVTDKIIAQLEAGTAPWRKPWNSAVGRPQNLDGRPYRGVNIFLLGLSGLEGGFRSPFWLTYKQAQERGGTVKRGEHGTLIVFWKTLSVPDKEDPAKRKVVPMLRYFYVFNLDQTEGVKVPKRVTAWETAQADHEHEPVLSGEEVISGYLAADGPTFRTNGTSAYYSPESDVITVPALEAFANRDEYYSTAFHEIAHSTGHVDRLDRFTGKGRAFGCHDYGREELVAELSSAFLQAECGIESAQDNSAAYLASWVRTLKEDPRAIVVAAGAAQRAADLVLGRTQAEEHPESVETTADTTTHHKGEAA